MASYPPPTENLPIFDDIVFQDLGDEPLTYNDAKKYFLTFPNAQGDENLQGVTVNGTATFNGAINLNGSISLNADLDMNNNDIIDVASVTATTFNGTLNGNASTSTTASSATQVAVTANANNANHYLTFSDTNGGTINLHTNAGILVNPSTDTITATAFSGNITATTGVVTTNFNAPANSQGAGSQFWWSPTKIIGGTNPNQQSVAFTTGAIFLGAGQPYIVASWFDPNTTLTSYRFFGATQASPTVIPFRFALYDSAFNLVTNSTSIINATANVTTGNSGIIDVPLATGGSIVLTGGLYFMMIMNAQTLGQAANLYGSGQLSTTANANPINLSSVNTTTIASNTRFRTTIIPAIASPYTPPATLVGQTATFVGSFPMVLCI